MEFPIAPSRVISYAVRYLTPAVVALLLEVPYPLLPLAVPPPPWACPGKPGLPGVGTDATSGLCGAPFFLIFIYITAT